MVDKWVISDTHFGHKNIIKFLDYDGNPIRPKLFPNVPFDDIQQHDELLIHNWNSVVRPGDKVYHLGDVGNVNVLKRLNGRKRLFVGNHDHILTFPAEFLSEFEDIRVSRQFKKEFDRAVIFTHHPIHREDNGKAPRLVNVHGHIHEKLIRDKNISDPWYINVCIEHLPNYTPVSFDYINKKLKAVP